MKPASDAQLMFLQDMLEKAGRRPLTIEEMAGMTMFGASNMIKALKFK